jgi:hypothetical protein
MKIKLDSSTSEIAKPIELSRMEFRWNNANSFLSRYLMKP